MKKYIWEFNPAFIEQQQDLELRCSRSCRLKEVFEEVSVYSYYNLQGESYTLLPKISVN